MPSKKVNNYNWILPFDRLGNHQAMPCIQQHSFLRLLMMKKSEIKIEEGYVPGSIGRISELHATYYNENWDFGLYFESKVAEELSAFLKR